MLRVIVQSRTHTCFNMSFLLELPPMVLWVTSNSQQRDDICIASAALCNVVYVHTPGGYG